MDPARARELLAHERARIERSLEALRHEAGDDLSHADQHLADEGSELYEQERDAGLSAALRQELEAIGRAEERLADGTFGRSVDSGTAIPDARLEAVPHAERTIDEQSRYERA